MFDNLTDRLSNSFKALQGKSKLSESNIKDAIREVRRSLLEADVALEVIKVFIDTSASASHWFEGKRRTYSFSGIYKTC